MTRHKMVYLGVAVPGLLWLSLATAQEEEADQAKHRAKGFLTALTKADANALKDYYAPRVLVKARSEFLRAQWGLNPGGDTSKDVEFERDKLLTGYAMLIKKAGKRWTDVWTRVVKDDKTTTLTHAKEADKPFAGVLKGDLILKVTPGPSDDTFTYIFRADAKQQWRIVIEAADY